jgi:hypothetical protein
MTLKIEFALAGNNVSEPLISVKKRYRKTVRMGM